MSPAQTAIAMASAVYEPAHRYNLSRWVKPRITKLPHDKATKRRRARNKAARKSRQRNR